MATAHTPGRFVWHEMFTNDLAATKKFYSGLVGWTVKTEDMGDMKYDMIVVGETPIGGLMPLEVVKMPGVPPHWLGYVSVPNVKEAVAATEKAKGTVLVPATPITVGEFAILRDPEGAVVAAWKGKDGDPPEVEKPAPGTICWDSVAATDGESTKMFYRQVFGWTANAMGPTNWMFKRGDREAASLEIVPKDIPPHWLCYILVENLDATRAKVEPLGGTIVVREMPVPNIGKFAVIRDNQGAAIGLFQGT